VKILFIGGGNMCQAIVGGLIAQGMAAREVHVIEPVAEAREALARLGVSSAAAVEPADLAATVIVLAVKPQAMKIAIAPLAGRLNSQLVVSIAAGIQCRELSAWLGTDSRAYANLVRAMPNTPALIRAGISGLFAMPGVSADDRQAAENLLGAVGETAWFAQESMLDAVTAVSGSGPAYVFYFIEALEQAAVDLGFEPAVARMFALQTFLGGARLAAGSAESPDVLRQRVTSRRGTTERAIETFDALELKQQIVRGVKAACERSRELGEEMRLAAADGGQA
jgi:pyrroline-5-carboxylate reductase